MAISITTPTKNIVGYEDDYIDEKIYYDGVNVSFKQLSSTLPQSLQIINDEMNKCIQLYGKLPLIEDEETYYVSYRLTDNDDFVDGYFEIINKNRKISWNPYMETTFKPVMMTDFLYQIELDNASGNEVFKKIEGNLPDGLSLTSSGLITGTILESNEIDTPYNFTVGVYIDNEMVSHLEPQTFTIIIENAHEDTPAIWITESGVIGSLSFGETSYCKVSAYNVYGSSSLSYVLDEDVDQTIYRLPPGLLLNKLTGNITGTLSTTQIQEWKFKVLARKIVNGVVIDSESREFSIRTNEVSEDHKITWEFDNNNLGNYYIGNTIIGQVPLASVEDGSTIRYSLSGGNIPDGLILEKNGTLSGILGNQDKGEYIFNIKAETDYTYLEKPFILNVNKGLGHNAIRTYLRFNLEYRDEYNNIRNQLNPRTLYKNDNENFNISTFPKIDIANLSCYDREVLSYMFDFGNPEVIRIGKTESTIYSQVNANGDCIENYEVIYKPIDESTYHWGELNIGNYDFNNKLQQLKDAIPAEMEDYAEIDFNNDVYNSNVQQLITNEDGSTIIVDNRTNPSVSYSVFNFENVRNILSQRIYVYKKLGIYEYDLGSQEIVVDNDETYHTNKITNPWCFDRDLNNNSVQLSNLENGKEMVMPMITDDDIEYDEYGKPFVRFLKTEIESLPEWKRAKPITWTSNTEYNMNDIIIDNNTYYKVLQRFKSGSVFEYDANTLKIVNSLELNDELEKVYYPTLDLGYFESGTNRNYINVMNKKELSYGDFWYNKDFLFYEIICEPIFNSEIETFGVQFAPMEHIERENTDTTVRFEIKSLTDDAIITINGKNVNYVDVEPGTLIEYSVSKHKHYTISDSYKIITDETLLIELKKKVRYSITCEPSADKITLITEDGIVNDDEIFVAEGTRIEYLIEKEKYVSKSGFITAKAIVEMNDYYEHVNEFILIPIYRLTIESPDVFVGSLNRYVTPNISLVADGCKQVDNYIDVPKNTVVSYIVSAPTLTEKSGKVTVVEDKTIPINLMSNVFTITINPIPSDSKVVIECDGKVGEQQGNSLMVEGGIPIKYTVSHDGYASQTITINGIYKDVQQSVYLGEYVTLTINPTPSDASIELLSGNFSQIDNTITVTKGSGITYAIKRFGYEPVGDKIILDKDTTLDIELKDLLYLVPETTDLDAFVLENNERQQFMLE